MIEVGERRSNDWSEFCPALISYSETDSLTVVSDLVTYKLHLVLDILT
jgi:hypothetical protein